MDTFLITLMKDVILNGENAKLMAELIRKRKAVMMDDLKKKQSELEEKIDKNKIAIGEIVNERIQTKKSRFDVFAEQEQELLNENYELQSQMKLVAHDLVNTPNIFVNTIRNKMIFYKKFLRNQTVKSMRMALLKTISKILIDNDFVKVEINLKAFLDEHLSTNLTAKVVFSRDQITGLKSTPIDLSFTNLVFE